MMEVTIEQRELRVGEDDRIRGTLLGPADVMPGILFVHGWGGTRQHDLVRAREAAARGCMCLTVDLRGHADDSRRKDTVTRAQNLDDLVAAYDEFAALPQVDPASMMVVGISYGGYLAALLTALRPVRWLALRSPALYQDEDWDVPKRALHERADLPKYRRRRLAPEDNRALLACAGYRGDVLLVEAENDEIIPRQVIENYRAAFVQARTLTSRLIPGADHGLTHKVHQRLYTDLLVAWITDLVIAERARAARDLAPDDA